MKILFVSAEVAPYAKVGGLADVAGSLPKALHELGHDVKVVMPHYGLIDGSYGATTLATAVPVPLNASWFETVDFSALDMDGVPVVLVGHESYFRSATRSDLIYSPGVDPYLCFSAAVLEIPGVLGWQPDVVHCNDWHTGFIPVLMRERYPARFEGTGAVYTIHNLAYQGEFGIEILDALDLPRSLYTPDLLETWGAVNFLKAGCAYSDQVNTVSPTYAREIQTPDYGCTLDGLMRHLADQGRLTGILNGIDTDRFDPSVDPLLPAHYSGTLQEGKADCRRELFERISMDPIPGAPLVGTVARLSSQKGLDLLARAAPDLFRMPIQMVVQGLGDPTIVAQLRELQSAYPGHVRVIERFDEDLARLIYAGSDLFAMPSVFEPCGLGQMIAMRYGTLPVVRSTGGLADTVFEGVNGFTFEEKSESALISAFTRAVDAYRKPDWHERVANAMATDQGWDRSAVLYAQLYGRARAQAAQLKLA